MPYLFNINKPDIDTQNNIAEIYDKYDYQLTPKKIFVRVVLILLVTLEVCNRYKMGFCSLLRWGQHK